MFQSQRTDLVTLDICWSRLRDQRSPESNHQIYQWNPVVNPMNPIQQEARALFEPFLPCDDAQLRKVYLRLALKYHPDKHPKAARERNTRVWRSCCCTHFYIDVYIVIGWVWVMYDVKVFQCNTASTVVDDLIEHSRCILHCIAIYQAITDIAAA